MTNDKTIKAVIFDMDGVLCDSEEFICQAACLMFKQTYGVEVQPEDFIPFVGAGENRYLGGVAKKYGITWDQERDKARTYEIYLEIIKGQLEPLPGVKEFIAQLSSNGLKLAVATSADLIKMQGNLAEIDLPAETFDTCVNGLDVEHKKPDPEIFLTAATRVAIAPEDCLVVEDACNGVRAAKAAGARCLGLTSSFTDEQLQDEGADWTAPDLANVPEDLKRLLGISSS